MVYLLSASALAVLMFGLWLWSLHTNDVSHVDIFWGPASALVAWCGVYVSTGHPRVWLLASLTSLWALRLAGYLAWRNHRKPEDFRYAAMRRKYDSFRWQSIYIVFGLQGLIAWVISLPLQSAASTPALSPLGHWDILGLVVFLNGLLLETVGDYQLARFKSDPSNAGKVMDRGLWRYTRHPNYFGDACVWWGLFALSYSSGAAGYSAVGPIVMTFFLMKVSGVALLERTIERRRPGYAEYIRRTNAFFPGPPRA